MKQFYKILFYSFFLFIYNYSSPSELNYTNINCIVSIANPTIAVASNLVKFVKCVGSASQAQTFTVSGSDLTSNIIITPPTGYEVSLDGNTWVSSLTLSQTSGSVSITTIYIRLTAAVTTINNNLNVTISTSGGNTVTKTLEGYINNNVTSGVIKSDQTICNGGDANEIKSDGNNGDGNDTLPFTTNISYIWQKSTDGGATWSVISGANSSSYNPPAGSITVTTKFRRITVSSNLDNTSTTFTCQSSPSNIVTVTVNPLPTVDFTFTNNQCSGSAIQFNSDVSGAGPSYSYSWNFGGSGGGNTSNNANPTHTFNNTNGNSSQSFSVSLTVTSNGCSTTITKVVTIQNPDASINSSVTSDIFDGFPIFKVCSNDTSQIDFINASSTSTTNSNYLISWGDSTPNFTSTSFLSTSHIYSVGLWTLTYTVTSQNGCSISKIYKVFVGNNPAVGLGNPGNTNICISTPLTFPITGTQDNPPGTTYTITFNDGSNPTVYNHPPPASITHTFLSTSCNITSLTYQNSFSATIVATNPCDTSQGIVVPIRVSTPPVANFTIPQPIICTNNQICFTNSSTGGSAVSSSSCAVPKLVWIISPSSGFILNSGTLGSDNNGSTNTNTWTTGTNAICPIFSVSGTYTITLKIGNSCGIDQIVKTICVETPLIPQFTLNTNAGCTPLAVAATNTTNLTSTCPGNPTYLWNVTYAAGYCGSTSNWSFANGTTATSANPSFSFINPGTYSITLTATNSCGAVTTLPQTVIIKKPPTVTINSIPNLCLTGPSVTISPTAIVNSCAPASSNLTYNWNFSNGNGSPNSSTSAVPGTITYTSTGTFNVTLGVTNECGTTNASQSFVINPIPIITGPSSVCAGQSITLSANSAGAVTNPWVSSNTAIATVSATGEVIGIASGTATITFTNSSNCQTTKIITVNPLPTATLLGTTTVCLNDVQPTLTFTGSGGTAPYTFTYNINGGVSQTVTTTTGNSVTVSVPTSTTGTYVYNLTGVQDASSTTCSRVLTASVTVTVRPIPSATISGTTSICQSGTSPVITFTGSGGTAPYIFTYNINGGTNQTVTATSGNSVTVSVPTTSSGVYAYNLVSISYGTSPSCPTPQTGSATVTVNPLPTATIGGATTVCLNNTQPLITFTGSGGTSPYTFTYNINGGTAQTVTTTTGNSVTVSVPTSVAGTFTYNLVSVKDSALPSCTRPQTGSVIITVKQLPTATISGNTTICQGGTSPSITFTGSGGTAPYTFTYNINGGSSQTVTTITGNSVTVSVPTSTSGTFVYNLLSVQDSAIPSCSQVQTGTATIVINSLASATISGTTTICQGATSPVITFTGAGGTAPYTFTYNINGGVTQTITTTTGNSTTVTVSTSTAGVFTYNLLSVRYGSTPVCSQPQTGSATITINPSPIATLTGNTTVCLNDTQPIVTFTGSGGTSPYTFTYNINGGTSQTVTTTTGNSVTVSVPTSTSGTFTYNLTGIQDTSSTTCLQTLTLSVSAVVRPIPSATISGTTSICQSGTSPVITFTGSGGTAPYIFTYNINGGTNQTVTATSGNSVTVSVPTTSSGVYAYNLVSISYGTSPSCPTPQTGSATVTVNIKPSIPNQTATICSGDTFTVTPTNSGATVVPSNTTYTWTISTNTDVIGQSASSVAGVSSISQTLTNNTNTVQTVTYIVTPTSGAAGNCVGATFTITVTVNPRPLIPNQTAITCSGTAFTVPLTNAPPALILPAGTTYTWTVASVTGINGTSNQIAPGVSTISQVLTNTTNSPIDVVYNVTASSGTSPNNCTSAFIVTVTVNPKPIIPAQTIVRCSGISFTVTPVNNLPTIVVPSGTTYSWSAPVIAGIIGAAAGSNQPSITGNLTNTTTSPIDVVYSITASSGTAPNNCTSTFNLTVTVNPSPSVTFSPASQTICSGSTTSLVNLSSTTPGVTFSWTATSNAILPLDISTFTTSGTNTIPVQTLVNSTASAITITYVATASTSVGSTCLGASFPYTITVNPKPAIANITVPAICSGTSFNVTPTSSLPNINPTGTTYSWGAPVVTGGITGGVAAINQASITGTLNNPTNTVQTATYTVTPISNGCSGATFTIVVTVNPTPIIPAQTATICSGDTFTVTPTNSGATVVPSNTTYTWTISTNTDVIGQSASSVAGVSSISQTLTNNTNTVQTVTYIVTPTSGAAGNCVGATFTITVTVNPRPLIPNQTAITCSGTAFTVPLTNAPPALILPAGTTYTWTVASVTGINGTSNQIAPGVSTISQVLTNTTNSPIDVVYNVTASSGTSPNNCTSAFIVTVTVNPKPIIPAQTIVRCSGISFTVTPVNNLPTIVVPSGTTYSWSAPVIAGIIGAAAGSNQPSITGNLTNTTTSPIDVVYSITASSGTAPNNCTSTFNLTVTVNPSPSVTFSPASQTICSGSTTSLVNLSSTTPGVTFSWTAANVLGITGIINSSTPGTTTIPVQTLTNTTNAPIDVIYSATATTASGATCLGATSDYTIIVNPKPSIENQTITICNNQSFTINPINGIPTTSTIVPAGTLYTWTIVPNPNITGASAGSATSISQSLTNTSNTLQSIVYNVIPSYLNCDGTSFTITVNVNPTPSALFSIQNQTICNNTQSTAINLSSNVITGSINYSWICTNPPLSSDLTGLILTGTTNTIPSQLLVNNTPNPITITYQVTAEIGGINPCLGPPSFYTITVNPTFQASGVISNYNGYGVSVFGGTDGFIDLTVTGGSGIYTYTWIGPNGFTASTEDLSGLAAGTYTVTINDGYCDPIILTFILTQPPELLVQQDLSLSINATCFGYNNGAVGILITQESVSPYDYELYNSAGVLVASIINSTNLNPQFTGLIAGNYSIKVIDANNGIKIVNALIVTQPDDILITAATTPITCYGANNASITLTVTGGTGPYTAQWNNLATGFYQNNLSAGTYTILVTDSNNCTKPISVFIPEALLFTVNPVVKNISCFGANDGSINLNFVGGIPAINLVWSDGSTAGTIRNNLGPGTYSVTIIDGTPCTIFRTFTILEPQPLVVTASLSNALDCLNPNSGAINLIVSGGTPAYSYNWSNGSNTEDLFSITSGNYQVTVTDLNGCTNTKQYSIIRPTPIDITVTTQTTHDCDAHTVVQSFVAQATGGIPGYSYLWSNGQTGPILNTSINGTYQLTVTDSYGCSETETVIVDIPVLGYSSFNTTSYGYTTYGLYAVGDPIQFQSTITGDYVSVSWDFGDGTYSTELNPIHTYLIPRDYIVTQTVTYPFGCVYVQTISLLVEKGYLLVVPTAFTPNSDNLNDTYRPVTKALKNIKLDIYDTWGSLIYSETSDEILVGWDGKVKGFNAENGNYYSKVSAETFYGTTVYSNQTFVLIK